MPLLRSIALAHGWMTGGARSTWRRPLMFVDAELIETLRLRGGGIGVFTDFGAGDTGGALVLEVSER